MNLEENIDKRLIRIFSRFNLVHLLIKQRLQLVIQLSVNNVKLYLTVTVKLRKLRTLKVMNNKSGNVNSVTLKTMSILMRKKNQKLKLPTISLRLPHKFKTRNLKVQKKSASYSVLINLDPCVFLLQSKEKLTLKVTRKTIWKNSRNLEMDPISSYREKEMLHILAECSACKQLLMPKLLTWVTEQPTEKLVLSLSTMKLQL